MRADREEVGPTRAIRKTPRPHPATAPSQLLRALHTGLWRDVGFSTSDWSLFNQRLISVTLRDVETSIELRYAGVVIGKATVSGPIDESGENSVFVPVPDPLPVGTKVGLKIDDRTLDGRVIAVAESTESSKCGMKIRIGGASSPKSSGGSASGATPSAPAAPAPSAPAAGAPTAPAPAMESAPIDGAVAAESGTDVSAAPVDGSSDGVPGGDEGGGQSGGQSGGGGGRRRRRRR
jgi:hypothetical protein